MNIDRIGRDADAFEAFYRAHVEDLQRFIARRVDDPYTAADLTSEVFLAVLDSAAGYDPARGSPRAWLFGIARHAITGERRRSLRQAGLTARQGGRRELEPDALERAAERLDAEREARALMAKIDLLPERLRAVVELVAVDGLAVEDAAAALGITGAAARVRLHRGRRKLISGDSSTPTVLAYQGGTP